MSYITDCSWLVLMRSPACSDLSEARIFLQIEEDVWCAAGGCLKTHIRDNLITHSLARFHGSTLTGCRGGLTAVGSRLHSVYALSSRCY